MCGRFDIDARHPEIKKLIRQLPENSAQLRFGEIYPGENVLTINANKDFPEVLPMKWGFPLKQKKSLLINARAETVKEKPMFAKSLQIMPVAIPATGFYEWKTDEKSAQKEKFLFREPAGNPFFLAGIGRIFPDEPDSLRFTILTTYANGSVSPYHERMPVLLEWDEARIWLDGSKRDKILGRVPFALAVESAK